MAHQMQPKGAYTCLQEARHAAEYNRGQLLLCGSRGEPSCRNARLAPVVKHPSMQLIMT